jgi:[ribosomal protein S5]-alanine N-acetyltransferase
MKERILKGKKVFLRQPKTEDFAEFSKLAKASRKFHRGLVNPPKDREGFDEYLLRNEKPENACFLICALENKVIAGTVNLSQIFRSGFQNAYLGYYLFAGFTGKGLMTEAIRLILKYSFKTLKLHRIEANVQPQNKDSIAVLQRAGFTKEGFSRKYLKFGGRWRDHERWAIIVEDWRKI